MRLDWFESMGLGKCAAGVVAFLVMGSMDGVGVVGD